MTRHRPTHFRGLTIALALGVATLPFLAMAQTDILRPDITEAQLHQLVAWESGVAKNERAAQYYLGESYLFGINGAKQNVELARILLDRAYAQGSPGAAYYLGVMASRGDGEPVDKAKARRLWEVAAKNEHPQALYNLGLQYDQGKYVTQDFIRALQYYDRAANAGLDQAAFNAASIRLSEFNPPREETKAVLQLQQAADGNIAIASSVLGWAHESGVGVPKNISKAIDHYLKAEAGGDMEAVQALNRIGKEAYELGLWDFNSGEREVASKFFEIGCNAKHGPSCYGLGWAYLEGSGVAKDLSRAAEALGTACKAGEPAVTCAALASTVYGLAGEASPENNRQGYNYYTSTCRETGTFDQKQACLFQSVMEMHTNWGVSNYKVGYNRGLRLCLSGGHKPSCDYILPIHNANIPPAKPRRKKPGWFGKLLGEMATGLATGVAAMGQMNTGGGYVASSRPASPAWANNNASATRQANKDWNQAIRRAQSYGTAYTVTCRPGNPYC